MQKLIELLKNNWDLYIITEGRNKHEYDEKCEYTATYFLKYRLGLDDIVIKGWSSWKIFARIFFIKISTKEVSLLIWTHWVKPTVLDLIGGLSIYITTYLITLCLWPYLRYLYIYYPTDVNLISLTTESM